MVRGIEMRENFLEVISEVGSLNSKIFSLSRMELLASLSSLGQDGATYRELKAALDLSDGALYSNLKALEEMGYLKSVGVEIEGKSLESYVITPEGKSEWVRVRRWLSKFLACGGAEQ